MGKQQDVFWESNPTNIKSTVITERYAHLAPEHLSEEMNRVEKWHQEGTTSVELKKRRNGSIRNSRPS